MGRNREFLCKFKRIFKLIRPGQNRFFSEPLQRSQNCDISPYRRFLKKVTSIVFLNFLTSQITNVTFISMFRGSNPDLVMRIFLQYFVIFYKFGTIRTLNWWKRRGVVVHSLGFSAEGSGFESRPEPSESMKSFSSNKLIPSTQNSTNVDSNELHL